MVPEGSDAISPAPHHDIYSIEDLRQLVCSLKEATEYRKPVIVKVAAVHNIAAIASGIARSGADIIAIDGFRGGTGAAPTRIRDHVGIPVELALAAVDQRLRDEGIRNQVSILAGAASAAPRTSSRRWPWGGRLLCGNSRAAGAGMPLCAAPARAAGVTGDCHPAPGAGGPAGPGGGQPPPHQPDDRLEQRDQGVHGWHGHQFH